VVAEETEELIPYFGDYQKFLIFDGDDSG